MPSDICYGMYHTKYALWFRTSNPSRLDLWPNDLIDMYHSSTPNPIHIPEAGCSFKIAVYCICNRGYQQPLFYFTNLRCWDTVHN